MVKRHFLQQCRARNGVFHHVRFYELSIGFALSRLESKRGHYAQFVQLKKINRDCSCLLFNVVATFFKYFQKTAETYFKQLQTADC